MNTFENYSRFIEGEKQFQVISFTDFEAKKSGMDNSSIFFIISGIAIIALAGLSVLSIPPSSGLFYATLAGIGVGVSIIAGTVKSHYGNSLELQALPLPEAKTESEYLALLDLNVGNRYAYEIPDLISHHKEKTSSNLEKQTARDIDGGNVYLKNGKPFRIGDFEGFKEKVQNIVRSEKTAQNIVYLANAHGDPLVFQAKLKKRYPQDHAEIVKIYKDFRGLAISKQIPDKLKPYANQALFADMMGVLQGRYKNQNLNIHFQQRAVDSNSPGANSSIDIVEENGKQYIVLRQLFQISSSENDSFGPFYLTAELKIDLENGSGRLEWHSPQTQRQKL